MSAILLFSVVFWLNVTKERSDMIWYGKIYFLTAIVLTPQRQQYSVRLHTNNTQNKAIDTNNTQNKAVN